jgi:hypothetical protein
MKTGHPSIIKDGDLVHQSLRILDRSHDEGDRRLVIWVKLVRIAHAAAKKLVFGATMQPDGLDDDVRDQIVQNFEDSLQQWAADYSLDELNGNTHHPTAFDSR